jgi:hypothetical protein
MTILPGDRPLILAPLAVDQPVTHIILQLQRIEEARRAFNLGGIILGNFFDTLDDSVERLSKIYPFQGADKVVLACAL